MKQTGKASRLWPHSDEIFLSIIISHLSSIGKIIWMLADHGAAISYLSSHTCPSYLRNGRKCIWQTVVVDFMSLHKEAEATRADHMRPVDLEDSFREWYKADIVTDERRNKVIYSSMHRPTDSSDLKACKLLCKRNTDE
jgi:hypothetical protein